MNLHEAVTLLETIALRGFTSEPVPYWLDKTRTALECSFTEEEKKELNKFLGENQYLAKLGRHEIGSMFGEPSRKTVSLLYRISYAMNGSHISPDYVSGLAGELAEVENTREYEIATLNKLIQRS